MSAPELLAVGHVTWDVLPDDLEDRKAGGAVSFAAGSVEHLDTQAAIVSTTRDDYPTANVVGSSDAFAQLLSGSTSTFENRSDVILHAMPGKTQAIDRHSGSSDGFNRP